jgi:hypothetical protein
MPRSLTIAVTSEAGVTSKAGLRTRALSGAARRPNARRISSGDRSSITISAPEQLPGSNVELGAAT